MMKNTQLKNKVDLIYKETEVRFQKLVELFTLQELGVIFSRAVLNTQYHKIDYKQQMLHNIDEYSKQNPKDTWSEFEKSTIKKLKTLDNIVVQMIVHKMLYLFDHFNNKIAEYPQKEKIEQLGLVTENVINNIFVTDNEPIKNKVIGEIETVIQLLLDFEDKAQGSFKGICTWHVMDKVSYGNIDFLLELVRFYHQNDRKNYMNELSKITLDADTDGRGIYDAMAFEIEKIGKHEVIKNRIKNMFRYNDYYFNNIDYKSAADMRSKLEDMYKVNIQHAYLDGDRTLFCRMLDKYEPRMGGKLAEISFHFEDEITDENDQTSYIMYIKDYTVN